MGLTRAAANLEGEPELFEREQFVAMLEQSFGEAQAGKGRLVLVEGEGGIGKTALVECFCRMCMSARVLWGRCDALLTPRPLGPFADMAAVSDGALAEAIERGEKPAGCLAALVRELETHPATIVVVEDLHWADEATLDVLAMLGPRVRGVGALVIATYRDDGLAASDPFRAVLGELRGPSVRRLSLPPLSVAGVNALAAAHEVDGAVLHERTGGNPFFVTEILAVGGRELPETVRDAVLARAGRMGDGARRVLDMVASVPERAEVWLLEVLLGAELEHLDECLASGMLRSEGPCIAFRHELARLAVECAIPSHRAVALHRRVLAALREEQDARIDPARLAHHAEAADDADAVLEFAPAAGDAAAARGAHREAASQYRRAVRFVGTGDLARRAELLRRCARECHMLADFDEESSLLEEALECYRDLGDRLNEGATLQLLGSSTYCHGDAIRSTELTVQAVEVLEQLEPGRELAHAYGSMSSGCMNAEDAPGTFAWGAKAVATAERLDDVELRIDALNDLGTMEFLTGLKSGREKVELSLELSQRAGFDDRAGRAFIHLCWVGTRLRRYDLAEEYVQAGIDYCTARDLDLHRHFMFAYGARVRLDRARWDDAADYARRVTDDSRASPDASAPAHAVLGLVRARRGDPDSWSPLDTARALAVGGDLQRTGPVAAARAELLWLEGRASEVDAETNEVLELALHRNVSWVAGELAYWRWRAGIRDKLADGAIAAPYEHSVRGDWEAATEAWQALGCPYESALALADSPDELRMRHALDELHAIGARLAAAVVSRRLRERGVRALPRGPRAPTRDNPAGLTARELQVAALLADGLRNAQIAQRLVVSEKTVDHHVSAVLRKLEVSNRHEAGAKLARLDSARSVS